MLKHYTYEHSNDIKVLNSLGLSYEVLRDQTFDTEDRDNARRVERARKVAKNQSLNNRLAYLARGRYQVPDKDLDEIDDHSPDELRERCKTLLSVNR